MMLSAQRGLAFRSQLSVLAPRRLSTRARVAEKDAKDDVRAFLEKPDDEGLADMAKAVMESDPELQAQMKKIQDAMVAVDRAKASAVEVEKEYLEAAKEAELSEVAAKAETKRKAEQMMADAEVAAAEKLLMAAELQNAQAQREMTRLASQINVDAGRVESGKAAVAATLGGCFSSLPFLILSGEHGVQAALSFLAAASACALFGVTYRYAIGSNPQNPHLRGGVIAAFGLVRAGAAADMLQLGSADGPFTAEVIGTAALYAGQSTLMFAFAAAVIEAGFQRGLIKTIDEQA